MRYFKPLLRSLLTVAVVALTVFFVAILWHEYVLAPWTRDGRVSADVVQIAPEVSGTVSALNVVDNQLVHRGDVLYVIDPERYQLAINAAQAEVDAKHDDMLILEATAERHNKLNGVVSAESIEQAGAAALVAKSAYNKAIVALNIAKLDMERSTIHSPVDGYVTNLRLHVGDYATAGTTKVAVLDANSFWITGYFEETKLRKIRVGDVAAIRLMGFDQRIEGRVESIGRGIADANEASGTLGLPEVDPVFTWVRLAQRIPVRIRIDSVPSGVNLAAGMTCSVAIGEAATDGAKGHLVSLVRTFM
ncbi:HlyD family secretion protein [Agrobacterium rhizogenes]|uniref:efflux RND transporter periplasmic adaptor subunit n=1 Tax=Rhizobium rhizogenes TaxID=359 RepID=UPI001574177F|nr:HlyD family secretion protein [Rhizobium rhizogenes]NTH16759.1 HlyD family secretion protein [Rhizobium rhizogenes]